MIQKIKDFIRKYHMIEKNDRIVIGVSGGADSMCLLFVLYELRAEIPMELQVVHVEHGIRREASRADAEFVKQICQSLQLPYREVAIDCPALSAEWNMTLEEAGRAARYDAFEREKPDKIAVAHHQNDAAETLLFHLFRGTGLRGLGAIPPVRGKIIRPLLCVTAEEIRQYLLQKGITWREDETNFSDEYARNRIRHHIVPAAESINPKAVTHMSETALRLREIEEYMTEVSQLAYDRYRICGEEGKRIVLSRGLFLEEKPVIVSYVLQKCLCELTGKWKDITAANIADLIGLSDRQSGKRIHLPGGLIASRSYEKIVIEKEFEMLFAGSRISRSVPMQGDVELPDGRVLRTALLSAAEASELKKNGNIPNEVYTKWFDYDKIKNSVVLRTRQTGDYFYVNSGRGTKKLKSYFIDEKIPIDERNRIFLLADGNHILWIPGYRICEGIKVTDLTKQIWEVSITKEKGNGNFE